jgi:hypothetical protein
VYRVFREDDAIKYKRVFGVYKDNGTDSHVSGATTSASKFSIALDQP